MGRSSLPDLRSQWEGRMAVAGNRGRYSQALWPIKRRYADGRNS